MSDFWARKLGGRAAPPPRETRALDAWWATPAAPAPASAPQPAPYQPPDAASRSAVVKAQWAKNPLTCPECGSGDYFKPEEGKARCWTCGYPVRHSTSGVKIPSHLAPATPTRQLKESMTNNFQPHTIVGRVE